VSGAVVESPVSSPHGRTMTFSPMRRSSRQEVASERSDMNNPIPQELVEPESQHENSSESSDAGSDELQEQEFLSAHSDVSDQSDASEPFRVDMADVEVQIDSTWSWPHGWGYERSGRLAATDVITAPWYIVALTPERNRLHLRVWFLLEIFNGERSSWALRSLMDVLDLIHVAGDGSINPYMKRTRRRRPLMRMIRAPTKKGKAVGSFPCRPIEFVRKKLTLTLQTARTEKLTLISLQREMLSNFLGMRTESTDGMDAVYMAQNQKQNSPEPPAFFQMTPQAAKYFARAMKEPSDINGIVGSVIFEGRIAEEYLAIQTSTGALKIWAPFVPRPRISINIDSVVSASIPEVDIIARFYTFVIQTHVKTFTFVVPSKEDRDNWVQKTMKAIPHLRARRVDQHHTPCSGTPKLLVHPLILDSSFSRRWVPSNRIILNDRRIVTATRITDPVKFSQSLLNAALEFGGSSPQGDSAVFSDVEGFFRATDDLKSVSFDVTTPTQKLAFWLNIYHTLMLHGFLQIGRPNSKKQLTVFQNRISYLVEAQPFSLTEIEFLILRHDLSKPMLRRRRQPTSFWRREKEPLPSKDVEVLHLPRKSESSNLWGVESPVDKSPMMSDASEDVDMHLLSMDGNDEDRKSEKSVKSRKSGISETATSFWTRYTPGFSEPRINFVLNNGTLCCLDSIMVFDDMGLENQLMTATQTFMQAFCRVEALKFGPLVRLRSIARWLTMRNRNNVPAGQPGRIILPYCIRRFRKDIEFLPATSWIQYACQFLAADKRDAIENLPSIAIKYHKYRCTVHPSLKKMRK